MSEVLTGGCQCGAVRYRVTGSVALAGVCHCRMCQKAGGNFGMAHFRAPELVFTRGEPASFESSPGVRRGFCRNCGTPLFMRDRGEPFDMTIGSLDRPDDLPRLRSQVGIESESRWFRDLAGVPKHSTTAVYGGREPGAESNFQHPDHDTAEWTPHPSESP